MLILTRKPGESIYIGDDIKITIVELKGHQIRVGIDAPNSLRIYREEIYVQILEENRQAAEAAIGNQELDSLAAAWAGAKKSDDNDDTDKKRTAPVVKQLGGSKDPQVVVRRKRVRNRMSEEEKSTSEQVTVQSSRFGEFEVPKESLIEFPSGLIGFPGEPFYVVVEHKPPFSWLHATGNPDLAFVVVDGFEFGDTYQVKPPIGDSDIDLKEEDEYAMLVIVTVRPDPTLTTANLKAPVFVNLRNRKGVQLVLDDARYSTRFPLWQEKEGDEGSAEGESKSEEKPPEK